MNKKIIFVLVILFNFGLGIQYLHSQKQNNPPRKNCKLDADDDGINDCFDQCPSTPKNVRVDSKGCPRDTDADGVPDYKDLQMITPTECQPSDSNGIGDCNRIKRN